MIRAYIRKLVREEIAGLGLSIDEFAALRRVAAQVRFQSELEAARKSAQQFAEAAMRRGGR